MAVRRGKNSRFRGRDASLRTAGKFHRASDKEADAPPKGAASRRTDQGWLKKAVLVALINRAVNMLLDLLVRNPFYRLRRSSAMCDQAHAARSGMPDGCIRI